MTQTTIAVICNGLKGEFDPDKRLFYYPRRQKQKAGSGEEEEEGGVHNLSENADSSHSRLFTPTEFERHAGMAASKKWKYSVRVDLEAEPEIDWDAAALGPFTLGKWLEENGYGSGSRSGKSSSSKARGGGGTSHSNATSMSVGGHSHGYGSENYHKDKTPSDAAAGVNKSCPRRQWLSSPQLVLQQQQENGMGSQHAPAAATTRTTTTTTLNGNATRRLAEFEKFRLHDTSPRIGSAFQIEIPDCLCCKPQQDPDTLAHPEREGTILFESEEEARQSALGPEKAGADALPLSAIYDTDGMSSDEESETIQREKSRRTRRRPKWLQGSVNMFTTEAEKEAMEKLEKLRPHHNHHHRGGHNNTSSNANSQGPDSTKQSVRTGGRKGGENLNLNEDDVTPRSKSRNPYFGAKGEKRQKKRWSDQKNSNDSSFKIGKIEKFGENEVLVLIVGRDGKKWTGSLRLVAEQRARKKAKASDDILGDNPRAAKAKRLLDQVTRMTERDSALKNLALMSDSASDEEVEEMVIEAQTEKGKARQQQQQLKQNAKSGLGGDLKAPPAGVSTKCATETVMVGGKVKTIHRGHGGRFASPNGPKAPSESENKHRVAGRPSQTNKSQEANANSIQQAMAAAAAAGLAAAQSQSLQQGAGGGEQAAQLLYYPPLMSQLNPAQQLSFMGMPGGWGPQFGFNQGMLSPEQFVKWNSMLASSAGMLQGQHSSAPVLQAPSNAQMNFPVNMGLMTMPHGRAPPGIPTNAIFQKNQQGHVFPPPPKMM